jgi:hypothetical protein
MIKNAFSVPGASKPEHIFYDSNCQARKQAEKDPWFADIGMCVDVWHFMNKHSQNDLYCQEFCAAAGFPELLAMNLGNGILIPQLWNRLMPPLDATLIHETRY